VSELGRSGVAVTGLGLGGAAIGGLYTAVDAETARATVARAYDAGIRYFDTAPHYGVGGSERHMGAALRGRDGFVLSTKIGRLLRPRLPGEAADPEGFAPGADLVREWDFTADGVRRSLESSLERLGLDHVDVVYIHDPDDHEDEVYATAYPALARLREEGTVRAIGAGMNQTAMLTRFVRRLDLDAVLCAGRYTLLEQPAAADLLPACLDRGTSVIIGGAYNSGLLIDPKPGAPYDYAPAPEPVVARARALRETCAAHGVPLPAAALAYVRRHPAVASVLVGCRTPAEVDATVAYWNTPIPDALWDDLRTPAGLG
jgi:D-threo-aldose 1-dehydrogenase